MRSVGRMTIELQSDGTSRPTPVVTFDPVGMFTPGMMHDHLMLFAREIDRAQAAVRHAARLAETVSTPTQPARRRASK